MSLSPNGSSGKGKDKSRFIGRVNFPLCTIDVVSERHVFVAGGGGRAKTGVPNKMVGWRTLSIN